MSSVNELRNMWESKAKKQSTQVPPIKPLPQKIVPPPKQAPSPVIVNASNTEPATLPIAKKTQSLQQVAQKKNQLQENMPRQSVAQLKQNLQGVLKPGMFGLTRPPPSNPQMQYKIQQVAQQPQQPKRLAKDIIPVKGTQRLPTFNQSKANLQQMFLRKQQQQSQSQPQGYQTGPPEAPYLDLKQNSQGATLSAEQRTQLVIQRIFTAPESSQQGGHQLTVEKKQGVQGKQRGSFMLKEEQVSNLSLRSGKRERVDLGDFDDA